jgi:hypothetical protein
MQLDGMGLPQAPRVLTLLLMLGHRLACWHLCREPAPDLQQQPGRLTLAPSTPAMQWRQRPASYTRSSCGSCYERCQRRIMQHIRIDFFSPYQSRASGPPCESSSSTLEEKHAETPYPRMQGCTCKHCNRRQSITCSANTASNWRI